MHRHSYTGRKLQRAAGPRKALIRGQITSLILHEGITTTEAKAKEVAPYFERLVTKAKQGDLAGQRAVRKMVLTEDASLKLINELAPAWNERHGGYTRVVKLGFRRGDNAPLARLALVLEPLGGAVAESAKDAKPVRTAKPAKVTKTTKAAEAAV